MTARSSICRGARRTSLALLTAMFVLLANASVSAAGKPVLAVMKFQDETGVMPLQGGLGRVVTNMLSSELAARDVFTVVERRKLMEVLLEQDLALSGRLKPGDGAKIGRLTGAQYLVMGTITAFEPDVETTSTTMRNAGRGTVEQTSRTAYLALDLRVVDTTSGEVRHARTIEGRTTREETGIGARERDQQSKLFENEIDAKAVRGAVLEIIDYLECVMVVRDNCVADFELKEGQRRDGTRRAFDADGKE